MRRGSIALILIVASAAGLFMTTIAVSRHLKLTTEVQAQTQPPAPTQYDRGPGLPFGLTNYQLYALDCTTGISVAATYPVAGGNPLAPNVYHNVEMVTGQAQAGLKKGLLLAQDVTPNGGTFATPNVVWSATGTTIQFYVYSIVENSVPVTDYTIHGLDPTGTINVSRSPADPPPAPYILTCPGTGQPADPPPVVALPPEDIGATAKKDMNITIRIFLPTAPDGTAGGNPVTTSLPVDFSVTNADRAEDAEAVTITMNHKGSGVWEGRYSTQHFPGTSYAFTVWPKKFSKKTICHVGSTSPHLLYPATYDCREDEGTILLKSGDNLLDFSQVKVGAGDLNIPETRDGHIDTQDLYQMIQYMREPSRDNGEAADLNLDGQVNQQDYDLSVWSLQNVPE